MAVQAQHPANTSGLFSTEYAGRMPRITGRGLPIEDPACQAPLVLPSVATAHQLYPRQALYGTTMFSGEQDSELTCNVSASRKRSREDLNLLQQQQQLWLAGAIGKVIEEKQPLSGTGPSASFHNSLDNSRLIDSAMSSTSGRSAATAPAPTTSSPAVNPLVQEFLSQLYHQSLEVDALIRLQVLLRSSAFICSHGSSDGKFAILGSFFGLLPYLGVIFCLIFDRCNRMIDFDRDWKRRGSATAERSYWQWRRLSSADCVRRRQSWRP